MLVGEYKSPGGLIRAEVELRGKKIEEIKYTGDFFIYPTKVLKELEEQLVGSKVYEKELSKKIREFYNSTKIETPELEPEDWIRAINRALEEKDEKI